jgi:hypothetical protein
MAVRFVLAAGAVAAAALMPLPTAAQVSPSLDQKVQNLQSDLTAKGYEVARGKWHLFTIDDCRFAIASMGFCMGNNPAAPYVIPTVPHWDHEFSDEHLKDLLGPAGDEWWTYRLGEREALVVMGRLPPTGAYFSVMTYAFTRQGAPDTSQPLYQALTEPFMRSMVFLTSPNPSRAIVFSSVGDSNNNVVIERQSGAAFGQERFFVITSDAGLARDLTEALLRAGVSDRNQVFAEHISPQIARLGLGSEADDFMTLIRYSEPKDKAAGDQWRQQLPLVVLRVRDTNITRQAEPYSAPPREERVARSELELANDVEKLAQGIKETWGQSGAATGKFQSLLLMIDLLGEHCLQRTRDCLGDNSDADYQISPTENLDGGQVLAVVGTLGTMTGNATYVSLSVNWIPPLQGVLNVSDKQLQGTAAAFGVGGADKLYVHYFARDCSGLENCTEVTEQMVPRGGSLKIVQRNYVVPGSARGADPTRVVNPVVIVLDGASRPRGR